MFLVVVRDDFLVNMFMFFDIMFWLVSLVFLICFVVIVFCGKKKKNFLLIFW